jgi:hypothetical protein
MMSTSQGANKMLVANNIATTEATEVVNWRMDFALALGFEPMKAFGVAMSSIELHAVEALTKRGCPPLTALAIVE